MSDASRDARAAAAFDRALDLEGDERDAFVASLGDIRADVESLLASHAAMDRDFLVVPAPSKASAAQLPSPGDTVGRYLIEAIAGEGASGTVYSARQDQPNRLVAVKILRDALASAADAERFRREAEVLARLSHPSIAHVYDAGVHGGLPFIAMELVDGALSVTQFADAAKLGREARIELVERAAGALHHAHVRGVVHRDVKPANLMADREGRLRVLDFGIAALGAAEARGTAGTPSYMSPEQACGGVADARSDVYGLGAVLFELLTGRPPIDLSGLSLADALRRVAASEPVPPGLDDDLDAILCRALARDPERRYATAAEFADDLRRFLERMPVRARPATAGHAFLLFVRRRPALSGALGAAVLALVGGTVVSVGFAMNAAEERRSAEAARDGAVRQAYVAEIVAAAAAVELRDVATARLALGRAAKELRGFEWRHLSARLDERETFHSFAPSVAPFAAVSMSNGRVGVAGAGPGMIAAVRVLDLDGGSVREAAVPGVEHVTAVGVSADGETVIVGRRDGSLVRVSLDGPAAVAEKAHDGPVNVIVACPASGLVATGGWDGRIRLWTSAPWALVRTIEAHSDRVVGLQFSGSGALLASCGRDRLVRLFDPATGALVRELAGHQGSVEDAAFSPDGLRLATVSRDCTLRIWDLAAGGPPLVRSGHTDNVRAVAWSRDGARIVTASYDRTVGLWDARDAQMVRRFMGHEAQVRSVGFAGMPERIWSAAVDGVRTWNPGSATSVCGYLPCTDRWFTALAVSDDGREALVGGIDGSVTRLTLATGATSFAVTVEKSPLRALAFDGTDRVLAATNSGRFHVLSRSDGIVLSSTIGRWNTPCAKFDAMEGPRALVTSNGAGTGWAAPPDWPAADREAWPRADGMRSDANVSAAVHAATGLVVAGDAYGEVRAGRRGRGELLRRIAKESAEITAVAISRDGLVAVWGTNDGLVVAADCATSLRRYSTKPFSAGVKSIAFSADGTRLAAVSEDHTIRVLDAARGTELLVLRPGWAAACVAFTDRDRALVAVAHNAVDAPALIVWRAE